MEGEGATVPAWALAVVAILGPALTGAGAWVLNLIKERGAQKATREQTSFTQLHQIIEDLRESASEQEKKFQERLEEIEDATGLLRREIHTERETRHDCQKRLTRMEAHVYMLEEACRRRNMKFLSWEQVLERMTKEGSHFHKSLTPSQVVEERRTGEGQDTGHRRRSTDGDDEVGGVEMHGPPPEQGPQPNSEEGS